MYCYRESYLMNMCQYFVQINFNLFVIISAGANSIVAAINDGPIAAGRIIGVSVRGSTPKAAEWLEKMV